MSSKHLSEHGGEAAVDALVRSTLRELAQTAVQSDVCLDCVLAYTAALCLANLTLRRNGGVAALSIPLVEDAHEVGAELTLMGLQLMAVMARPENRTQYDFHKQTSH